MQTKNNRKNTQMKTVQQSNKKPTIDKQKLLAYILAGLMIFWTIASIFGFIAYGRTTKKVDSGVISANAQTAEEYEIDKRLVINNPTKTFFAYQDGDSFMPLLGYDFYFGDYDIGLTDGITYTSFWSDLSQSMYYTYYDSTQEETELDSMDINITLGDRISFIDTWTSIDYSVTCFISSTRMEFSHYFVFTDSVNNFSSYVFIDYSFQIPQWLYNAETTITFTLQDYHEWILGSGNEVTYDFTPNGFDTEDFLLYYYSAIYGGDFDLAYNRGYEEGYAEAEQNIDQRSYDKGYKEGERIGRIYGEAEGYERGVTEGANYSFDSLLSAVFDVPLRTFYSFFSFEILGIDFASFFLSLFAVAVFLAIIRFIF